MAVGIILKILVISLFCLGLDRLLQENMILGFIRPYLDNKLSPKSKLRYWLKPIVFCYVCFASFWGSIVYISISEYIYWPEWLICCIGATFINGLLYNLNGKLE